MTILGIFITNTAPAVLALTVCVSNAGNTFKQSD